MTGATVAGARALANEDVRAVARDLALNTDLYATIVLGDCMAPEIPAGVAIAVDPLRRPSLGDLVVIIKKPEFIRDGEPPGLLKRLGGPIVDDLQFPWLDPGDGLEPCLALEMNNPRKRLLVPYSTIAALHYCRGIVRLTPDGRRAILDD